MEVLNIRKLIALDISINGRIFILLEFGLAIPFALIIGHITFPWSPLLGWYIITVGLNYIPALAYAMDIVRKNSARKEARAELADRRKIMRYSIRQLIVFVPFSIILLTIWQEVRRPKQ
ncbi:MAG: hypothetical protein M1122_02735 [Candidatus Marsarchaeota archaeon]|nr:hypothetical protein [Candidatus Marsarchaeota archaeon]